MNFKARILSITVLVMLISIINAQPYEIRAVNKGEGIIGVEMRATSGIIPASGNNVTDIVFGLKWQGSYNVELVNTINTSYNIIKSDTRMTKNGYYFQAFSATNTPYLIPFNWTQNNWVEIMNIANTRNSADTGTFAICEPGFDNTTDPNFGLDLFDNMLAINGSAFGVVLPLILTKFEATAKEDFIQLSWNTSTEMNNKGFEIQRSVNEPFQPDSIGWVKGTGNANATSNYSYVDRNALPGVLYFYRLRQMDYDGKFGFSQIRSARMKGYENTAFNISPNPATSFLQVFFLKSNITGKVKVRVFDSRGSSVIESYSTFIMGGKVDINVSTFPAGQYYLVIEQNGNVIYRKPFQKG